MYTSITPGGRFLRLRTIVEAESYTKALGELSHDQRAIDLALGAILAAISQRPQVFAADERYEPAIRIAWSESFKRDDGLEVPALALRFRILDENTVELLHVEDEKEQ